MIGAGVLGPTSAAASYYNEPDPEQSSYFLNKPKERALYGGVTGGLSGAAMGYGLRDSVGGIISSLKKQVAETVAGLPGAPRGEDLSEAQRFINYVKKDMPDMSYKKIRGKTHPDVTQHNPDYDPEFMGRMFKSIPGLEEKGVKAKPDPFRKLRDSGQATLDEITKQENNVFPSFKSIQKKLDNFVDAHQEVSTPTGK